MSTQPVYANLHSRETPSEDNYWAFMDEQYDTDEWRPIPSYPDYEISASDGYIRLIETKEWVDITSDGKGLRLVWFLNKKGKGVALKKAGDLWKEAFPEGRAS